MSAYIHQLSNWPNFEWNSSNLISHIAKVRHEQGRLAGRMESVGFPLRDEAVLQTLTMDVLKSSEIEGENLDIDQVRSSIARRLGIDIVGATSADRNVDGVVEMMLDATQKYDSPLTRERLFGWHAALFPTGYSGIKKIRVGVWRDGPMQVVSGPIGHEWVHFEAPVAERVPDEMQRFLVWFNQNDNLDLVLKAFVAHIWFLTVHPFEDGNGRISRAIVDMLLARSEKTSQRFYSLSAQIRLERDEYYNIIEEAQKGTMDITNSLEWFLGCLGRALDHAEITLNNVLRKSYLWNKYSSLLVNERQKKVVNLLINGLDGKLTSTKWAKISKCSQDTATRDINDLLAKGVLKKALGGGRSTNYVLNTHSGEIQPS